VTITTERGAVERDVSTAPPSPRSTRDHATLRLVLGQLAVLAVSLLVASAVIFFAIDLLPGDLALTRAGIDASAEQVALIRAELGLDRPAIVRYLEWLGGALRGDLGVSLLDNRPVVAAIGEKMQVTLPLCLLALTMSVLVALPLGILAAVGRERWYGQLIGAFTQLGLAVPAFVLGLLLVTVFAVQLDLLPVQGFPRERWGDPAGALASLLLPAVTLAVPQAAVLARFVRSATADALAQDWVRTSRSRGWRLPAIVLRQGLRNTALPLIAVVGLEAAGLITGAVIVERVFALPGIGSMILADVDTRDLGKVQGTLLVLTATIMIMTLLLDLVYRIVDPRLRAARA
jgi:peptide/nickel transport system permease protein